MKIKKETILTFLIGLLIGAIIASGGFLICSNINKTKMKNHKDMGEPPKMMQDENFKGSPENSKKSTDEQVTDENTRKDKENRKNSGNNDRETPPEKPSKNDSSKQEKTTDKKQTTESNT